MNGRNNSHGIWQFKFLRFTRQWGLSIAVTFFAVLWLTLIAGVWAEAKELNPESDSPNSAQADPQNDDQSASENSVQASSEVSEEKSGDRAPGSTQENNSDDEYSFNWLDTDKKIYVLQNRKFLKAGRVLLSAMGGVGFSNPYRSTYNVDPRFTYYLSESFGVEVFYTFTSNSPNNTFQALASSNGASIPSVREIHGQYGGDIQYIPWYAKINVFNTILHFDWYFNAGVGQIQSFVATQTSFSAPPSLVQQDLTGLFLSTGHLYHLNTWFDVRIDVTGAFYSAPIKGLAGDTSWYSNYNFGVGVGLKL